MAELAGSGGTDAGADLRQTLACASGVYLGDAVKRGLVVVEEVARRFIWGAWVRQAEWMEGRSTRMSMPE